MATYSLDYVKQIITNNWLTYETRENDIWIYCNGKLLRSFSFVNGNRIAMLDFKNWCYYMRLI